MSNHNTATLRTPYRNALSAFDVFSSIRKAEGLSPVTLTTYRSIVIPFLKAYPSFLENPRESIIRFVSEPENPWSRFSRIKVLKVFCRFLVEEGILEENPTKGIKTVMPEKRADIPDMESVREFITALDEKRYADRRLKVMLLIALDTGLRRGELCGLKLEDFDAEGMLLTVRAETSKVRRGRVVPLSSQVAREIRRFVALRPMEWSTPYLFPTEQGGKMNPDNFGLQIRRTSIRIGKPLKIHGLRHLCATEFLRSTGNIALTARLLGHTSIRTTADFYEHLNLDDLREAHEKADVIHGVMGKSRKRTL